TSLALVPDSDNDRQGTFLLTVLPPTNQGQAQRPRDMVFVLDRSGSMSGWKMLAARRALARMIETLSERDRFTVFAFDDSLETPPVCADGLAPATEHNRYRATEWLSQIDARGGTEMAQPLDRGVALLSGGRDRVLALV